MGDRAGFAGLVLAAGRGSRFGGEAGRPFPKVLRPVLGRPMVSWVLDALRGADIDDITLVVGFGADEVRRQIGPSVRYVLQGEQRGSGHAVACAKEAFAGYRGGLVVMCGDSPLFLADTVRRVADEHALTEAAATLTSARLDDPSGYGRIVRDAQRRIVGIVEEKCADEREKAIHEVNGGAYAFDATWLFDNIDKMAVNEAGEYNLTDMVRVAIEQGRTVSAIDCDPSELLGVNTPAQLAEVEEILRWR
jgi:bifunctional UDP-N-acetylglucosamine pyrophosphorylase / glucosamine-1-phosphate N-acetyltransferase